MKAKYALSLLILGLMSSCTHNSSQTWEDVKTAGRYMQRGVDALWGKDYESRMLTTDEEFVGPYDDEFIPLNASDLKALVLNSDTALPQPRGIPGEKGVPMLDRFQVPSESLGFRYVHFATDEHVLRENNDLQVLQQIAAYMKKTPNAYLLIEGHTDERASASYNVALGIRRANYVRALLVKNGIDLNRIYTVSHGKEQPLAFGHGQEDWKQNRRAAFKVFEK
jgi:peptidoglycan-associated lipoprotein